MADVCILCGETNLPHPQHLIACGLESASTANDWKKEHLFISSINLCDLCLHKVHTQAAESKRKAHKQNFIFAITAALVSLFFIGIVLLIATLDPGPNKPKIIPLIGAVAFTVFVFSIITLPIITYSSVKERIRQHRHLSGSHSGSYIPFAAALTSVAADIVNRQGIQHFLTVTETPDTEIRELATSGKKIRYRFIGAGLTASEITNVAPEPWKPWVQRRAS